MHDVKELSRITQTVLCRIVMCASEMGSWSTVPTGHIPFNYVHKYSTNGVHLTLLHHAYYVHMCTK